MSVNKILYSVYDLNADVDAASAPQGEVQGRFFQGLITTTTKAKRASRGTFPAMNRLWLIVAVACLSTELASAQTEPKLGITLQTKQQSYSLRGEIELVIVRENQGRESVLVPRQWGWGVMRTDIRVFDAKGHEVRTDFLADELPPPPQPYDFVLLEPGEFLGTHTRGAAKEFVNIPGEYEFVVEYTSYLSEHYAREVMKMPNEPFWSRERGTVTSNRVKVRVTE